MKTVNGAQELLGCINAENNVVAAFKNVCSDGLVQYIILGTDEWLDSFISYIYGVGLASQEHHAQFYLFIQEPCQIYLLYYKGWLGDEQIKIEEAAAWEEHRRRKQAEIEADWQDMEAIEKDLDLAEETEEFTEVIFGDPLGGLRAYE